MKAIEKVCVFCGADEGHRPSYKAAARKFGELLADEGCVLVYGGGSVGLMGVLADSVLSRGGHAIGIVPDFFSGSKYKGNEVVHANLSELKTVSTMQERKALMLEVSDAFVALPGGIGTLDELVEVWALAKLGRHSKPCGVLNVEGYFDWLLEFVDHMLSEDFIHEKDRSLLLIDDDPQGLLNKLVHLQPSFRTNIDFKI